MKSIQLASAGNPEPVNRPMMPMNAGHEDHEAGQPIDEVSVVNPNPNPVHSGVLPMDEKALSGLQARMERLKSGSMDSL